MADSSNVVVFSDPTSKRHHDPVSKAQMKAFMSSRISKLTSDSVKIAPMEEEQENDEEKTNTENDALLHRLVHTQLLSGSLNPDLNLTSAERKRALAGRILELTGTEKLGKGEKGVIEAERRRAGKRVREGLASKQKERAKQHLEEAKNLGNYHPLLKKTFEASSKTKTPGRRSRGLGMGVGRFNAGILKLSKEDISKVESGHAVAANRGRGR
ncbi:hypothetical protein M378DRAFT_156193 [Amanita muscaria Koide BX008]|uniref:Uncharacterized protein n=1 Tax=Amanita muscaria (strain Koide BX008) TaxID=946122 RepID=A0A0C2X729_AMAMK|nr:hypothetical protein M378DRAFT_156193 [Amanita muscaria Koide BX008]